MSEIQPLLSYPLLFNKLIYFQPLGSSAIDTSQCYFCSLSRKVKKMEVSVQTEVSTSRKKEKKGKEQDLYNREKV